MVHFEKLLYVMISIIALAYLSPRGHAVKGLQVLRRVQFGIVTQADISDMPFVVQDLMPSK